MADEQPPLFAGEPGHCSTCGEAGHTHDDHWLFQHEPVKALQTEHAEMKATMTDFANEARRAFIRDAAIRLLASYENVDEPTPPLLYAECWADAKALWDAKPEDC